MAGDVAQFLLNKFLVSLRETESEYSGAVLISDLGAIKDIVIDIDTRRLKKDYCHRFISVLLDLTDALTKCQVFSHELKYHSHHKTHLIFNHLSLTKICFVRKMKKRLAAIKRDFEAEFKKEEEKIYNLGESSSRPDPEENLESELPVLIRRGRKFEAEGVELDEQLRKIGNFLLKSSPSSGAGFAAVGILGMAGAGKTTLVREFLSWWIVQVEFSPIIWLCLSNIIKESKQVEEEIEVSIVKCMLNKLYHDAVVDGDGDGINQEEEKTGSSNNKSGHLLAALLERLNQHLSDKRYLIVLDDVWHMNDFYSDLGHRQQPLEVQEGDRKAGDRLSHGLPKGSGGAVIVTSRIPEVVEAMVVPAEGSDQHYNSLIIPLERLDRRSCWDIFRYLPDFEYQHLEKFESEIKDLCYGLPLAARTLAEIMSQNSQNLRRTFPPNRKSGDVEPDLGIVFIDIHNRQQGEELIGKFCDLLTTKQVFGVLLEEAETYNPATVLKDLLNYIEKLKLQGYYSEIQKKMKIIVVGREVVVNWILGLICYLKLPESLTIAPVPSFTDGVAASFGWPEDISNISPLQSFLVDVAKAQPLRTDSWYCLIRMKPRYSLRKRLPHYFHEVRDADNPTLDGLFWNYFILDVGHYNLRDCHITSVAMVKVLNQLDQWEMLHIPKGFNSICCLNLPMFRSPDGVRRLTENTTEDGKAPTNPSFIDDGLLEVIGSKMGFYHESRDWSLLDQVRGIRFEFIEGTNEVANIRINERDQFEFRTKDLVEIEISYRCQVNILAGPNCAAKSIHQSSQSSVSQANAA